MADPYPGLDVRDESGAAVAPAALADLTALAATLLRELGMARDAELSVVLVTEDAMAQLHQEWLGEPGPTDVLSFPMDELREPAPGEAPVSGVLGDVVLCPSVAARQAETAGHGPQHELRILLTHGVLHLLGHDHADPDDERTMFGRQAQLVGDFETSRGAAPR